MNEEHVCPRRAENPPYPGMSDTDTWRKNNSCSYCGSFNPEEFMKRLEAADIELGPTDKNYKVYVKNEGGEVFKQTYRDCPRDSTCTGPDDCDHWITRDITQTKFYFQHLSPEQQTRFIELINEKKVKIGMPGHFYNLPFFCKPID